MTLVGTAATVVLLRDGAHGIEVLLLERPRHTGTFAGAWVFPGGRVDPEDYDAAGSVPPDLQAEPRNPEEDLPAARIAGVRETVEETGLVLAPESLGGTLLLGSRRCRRPSGCAPGSSWHRRRRGRSG